MKSYDSTEDFVHYYPEVKEYYCSFLLEAVKTDVSSEEFDAKKSALADYLIEEQGGSELTVTRSEENNFAGLSGWVFSYIDNREEESHIYYWAFALNPQTKELILVRMIYDGKDESSYDYDGDFMKILASAKNLAPTPTPESTPEPTSTAQNGIRPEFKAAMDDYEDFFDDYIAFMQKYVDSDDSWGMMKDYLDWLNKYADTMEALENIGEEDLSVEESKYYTEVMMRISTKLLNVSY